MLRKRDPKQTILRQSRLKLIRLSAEAQCPEDRRDWLLHRILHTHDLEGLVQLIQDFNASQKGHFERTQMPLDFIDFEVHDIGFRLGLKNSIHVQ